MALTNYWPKNSFNVRGAKSKRPLNVIEWRCQNFNRKFTNSHFCTCAVKIWLKIALNDVRLPIFEAVNRKSWSPRTMVAKDLRQRSMLTWFCACAESLCDL